MDFRLTSKNVRRVVTRARIPSGRSRLGALLALAALVISTGLITESPVLAVAYTYSFDNGGGGNTAIGGTQEQGTTISLSAGGCRGPGTSRPGYTLVGFRSSHDEQVYGTDCGGGYFSLNGYMMPSQNVVFTYVWRLDITYDSRGGTAVADGDTTTSVGATISALPTDPTRSGYTFAGWFTATSGGSQITASASHGQESHFTLYARWALDALTISYDSQGGSVVTDGDTTTLTTDGIYPLPTPPTRTGYTFAGWNSASDGTGINFGVWIAPGQEVAHGQTANFTLYAQWTGNTLTITYDSQSGSPIADGDSATTTGGSISTLPTDPTRSGYTFNGWFTATSGGSQITTSNPHGQISDFTLFAQWTQIPVQVAPTAPPVIAPAPPPSSFTIDMGDGSWCLVEHSNERIATDMSVPVGARFSVHGTQFQPDSDIEIWLNSTRVLFGTATAGIDNTFVLTSNLPDQIEPGEHTLEIVGINLAGDLQTTWIGLLVDDLERVETPDLELPITGRNDAVVLNWSLALLVAGILVGALSRRRRLLR